MKRRTRGNRKKIIILSSILVASLFMAVGYSLLSQTLQLEGEANLRAAEKYLWHKITSEYVATSGSGFYENNHESKKYSYVGDGTSNYISLNNELWRIVSVESDHTIKVVKLDDSIVKEYDATGNRTTNSTYCTNLENGCNAWNTKDTLTNGQISGSVENDSTMLTYLNTDFYNSLSDELKNVIVEHTFNIGSVNDGATFNEALVQENEYTWTGKIGLLNITEILYPSNNSTSTSQMTIGQQAYEDNYLLSFATGKFLWTMNAVNNNSTDMWTIGYDKIPIGKASNNSTETIDEVTYNYVALPTLYLSSTVEYNSGSGTLDNPFTIK